MTNKKGNPDSWQNRVITKSRVMEQDVIRRIVTAGAKSPEEADALYAAMQAEARADRLTQQSGAQFKVGSELSNAVNVNALTTTTDAAKANSPVGEAAFLDVNVPAMSPPRAQEGNVPIRVQVESKDGKFDPKWKEAEVNSGDIPTGVPQLEFASQTIPSEKERSLPERGKEAEKEKVPPITTEDVARLMDAVEETRTFYAEVLAIDQREQSMYSKVVSLFKNVKRVPDPAVVRAESAYREQLMLLQNMKLERIKQSGLKGQELKRALAEGLRYFKIDEAQALYEAQTKMQLQAMEKTRMGQLSQKVENFFRGYNKLSFTKKLGVAGGFATAAVATGGLSVWASRAFSGMALATSLNVAGDAFVQRQRAQALEGELVGALSDISHQKILNLVRTENDDEDEHDAEREIDQSLEENDPKKDRFVYAAYGRIPESELTDEDRLIMAKHKEAEEQEKAAAKRSSQVLKGEIPEEEWTDEERDFVTEYRTKEAELLYQKYSTFAERAIEVHTGRIEKWMTDDRRRRWAVRGAAIALGFIAGKFISEFVQSDTVKPLREAIKSKLSAGLEYFTQVAHQNTADSGLQHQTVMFDENFPEPKQTIPRPDNWPKDLVSQIPTEMTPNGAPGGVVNAPGISPTNTPAASGHGTLAEKFGVGSTASPLAQDMLKSEVTPTLSEVVNAERFSASSTASPLAQEMLAPEQPTPPFAEIVKDLPVSEGNGVVPDAVQPKIKDILTHQAAKGDTLWGDSIKLAKELGIDASKQNAFAVKVETVLREAIEHNPKLLDQLGFSEAEFTKSEGENLWLVKNKPVDYSSILTQEKLQEMMKSMTEEGSSSAQETVPPVFKPAVPIKTPIPDLPSSETVQVTPSNEFQAMTQNTGSAELAASVVAQEMSTSGNPKGQILTIRNVAGGAEPPIDIAALKQSLATEVVPAKAVGVPKTGAEAILAARIPGDSAVPGRFVDAALENSGSRKTPAGLVRATAEMLTPEKLAKQYSAEKFKANEYISGLNPAEAQAMKLKYQDLVHRVMVLRPGEVSPADFDQLERFRAYQRAGVVGVFPAQSESMRMGDIMDKFAKMERGEIVFFGFSLEKSDLHSTHIKHLGRFVQENIRMFGVVGTPGKEEKLAEYFARMLVVSEKAPQLLPRSGRSM